MNNVDKATRLVGGEKKKKERKRGKEVARNFRGKWPREPKEEKYICIYKEIDALGYVYQKTSRTKNMATLRRRAPQQYYCVPTNILCLHANLSLTRLSYAVIMSGYN